LSSHFLLDFHEMFCFKDRNKYSFFFLKFLCMILFLLFLKVMWKANIVEFLD
jgi:hypothetical protein